MTTMHRPRPVCAAEHGVATLTIVMVLFFILAMVAAYTNRTLIVDQRSAANSMRSAQAIEATEAGIEWALMQLNAGRIDQSCQASAAATDTDFRSRYTAVRTDGSYDIPLISAAPVIYYRPSCVAGAAGAWRCTCPTPAAQDPVLAQQPGDAEAFQVNIRLQDGAANQSVRGGLRIWVQGCSSPGGGSCMQPMETTLPQVDAYSRSQVWAGLVKALPNPPAAAITAGIPAGGGVSSIDVDAGALVRVVSGNAGPPVSAAGTVSPLVQVTAPAGADPADPRYAPNAQDAALLAVVNAGGLFPGLFGMDAATYRRQPGVVLVSCPAAGCTSADLATPLARFPRRAIWVDGNLTLDAAGAIGSSSAPALIVVAGTATFAAQVNYTGLIYADYVNWGAGADAATLTGAIVAAQSFHATVNASIAYDDALLSAMSLAYGSFARVPGGTRQQ